MERPTLADSTFATLTDRIAAGKIRPGDSLKEADLSEELDLSRTPIRSAIERLTASGLVVNRAYYTPKVVEPTYDTLEQAFQLRDAVEPMTARLMAKRGQPRGLIDGLREIHQDMQEALSNGNWSVYDSSDFAFHRYIIEHCGNDLISKGDWAQAAILISFFPHQTTVGHDHVVGLDSEITVTAHRNILEAIEARDPDTAEAAVRAHLQEAWRLAKQWSSNESLRMPTQSK